MKIAITFHSPREVKNLFFTPFFEVVKKDRENEYLLFTDFNLNLDPDTYPHIQIRPFPKTAKWKCLLYTFVLSRLYEYLSLAHPTSPDQRIFWSRHRKFHKKKYVLDCFFYLLYRITPTSLFKRFEKMILNHPDYHALSIDKLLVTAYHSFNEKQLFHSLPDVPLYFFTDGWDAFTKQTYYEKIPDRVFVWTENMRGSAYKNCRLPAVTVTGNPFWDHIQTSHCERLDSKTRLLFICNNQTIYNEENILKKLHEKHEGTTLITLRLPPVECIYERLKENYKRNFPNFLIQEIDKTGWFQRDSKPVSEFGQDYINQLHQTDYILATGPSTIILDGLALNKKIIICFILEEKNAHKWDWTETRHREILNDLYKHPNVTVCNSFEELESVLNTLVPGELPKVPYQESTLFMELMK